MKYLLFFLLGANFILLVSLGYSKFVLCENTNSKNSVSVINDNSKKKSKRDSLETFEKNYYDVKLDILTYNEKIASLNKRFDDLYILGGIIITLLLAITVSVYIKAESEVNKHFRDNFEKYQNQIIKTANDAEKILSEMKTKSEFSEVLKKTLSEIQNIKPDDLPQQPSN